MNKISVNEKETEMTISKSKQEILNYGVKDSTLLKVLKTWFWKQMQVTITCQLSFR